MKSLAEQIGSRCVHFNGIGNKQCEANVAYESVEVGEGPMRTRIPCFRESPHTNCVKCRFPTEEEVAAEIAEINGRFEKTAKARQAIVDHLGGPWKRGTPGAAGKIPCPVCTTGELRFSRAGVNGHIHAGCTTGGCVGWME